MLDSGVWSKLKVGGGGGVVRLIKNWRARKKGSGYG